MDSEELQGDLSLSAVYLSTSEYPPLKQHPKVSSCGVRCLACAVQLYSRPDSPGASCVRNWSHAAAACTEGNPSGQVCSTYFCPIGARRGRSDESPQPIGGRAASAQASAPRATYT